MKALVCSLNAPWPPMSGRDLRCWQSLNLLREWAEAGLFALGGSLRSPPEIKAALWRVAGSPAEPPDQTNWMKREAGLPSDAYYNEPSAAELRTVLEEFAPDVVVLDHLWMHSYEKVIRSHGSRLVLNAHNVEAALAREMADHETNPPAKLQRRLFASRVGKLEGEFANRMDQIWVCSPEDRRRFLDEYGVGVPVHVVPNAIDRARYSTSRNRPKELLGLPGPFFLFTGAFHYAPNQKAADFLIRDLFPKLMQAYPEGRLLLAGVNPTPRMLAAAEQDRRIIVTGRVPDPIPYLQHASIMLVPLWEGGGTRFKIIEAFAANLPVVSTAKGAEGLGAEPGKHFLLAEEPDEFLLAIGEMLSDQDRRRRLVQSAGELVERFSWNAVRQTVGQALRELRP
jgi:glycosyltransferase involved in cell wall biosynthesis